MWHKFSICLCIKLSIVQGGPAVENGDLFSLINRNQLLLWRDQPFILCWGTLLGKCRSGLAISLNGRPATLSVQSIILYLIGNKWLCLANGIKNNSGFNFFFFYFITIWILSQWNKQRISYWPGARLLSGTLVLKLLFEVLGSGYLVTMQKPGRLYCSQRKDLPVYSYCPNFPPMHPPPPHLLPPTHPPPPHS